MTFDISNLLLWLAAALSVFGLAGHMSAGRRMFVGALFETSQLTDQAKWLGYAAWHGFSVMLAIQAIGFTSAASGVASTDVAILVALMAGAVSLTCAGMGLVGGELLKVPAPYLFGLIALAGAAGLLTA